MAADASNRPILPTEPDRKRAEHQALRARLMHGGWIAGGDAEKALNKHIRPDRRAAWGIAEHSRNPFKSLSMQVGGALYREPPTVMGEAGGDGLIGEVSRAGYWQLMQRVSTDLVGVREQLVRIDWSQRGGLLHRPMPPECCVVRAVPEAPDVPAATEELQIRAHPETGEDVWTWEILSIEDLDKPIHVILSADRKQDWTEHFLGGPKSGEAYQFRKADRTPVIPVGMYHAERTGLLWDPYYGVETVLGTMTMSVLLTFWLHGVKDGSFATIAIAGGRVVGAKIESPSGQTTQVISTEPGSIIEVSPVEDYTGQVSIVQLRPGFEPEKLMSAIDMFGAGLAEYAGVSAADLVRTGADPRSGASLSISREGLRTAQARHEPQLRRGDSTVLDLSAIVLNRATGTSYPEQGYTLSYPSLPLSIEENRALREDLVAKVDRGLMSKVDAYMRLHPGLTREQAIAELQRIQRENLMFQGPVVGS
jgi:hypothetical protein